jgi:hypothetical protein
VTWLTDGTGLILLEQHIELALSIADRGLILICGKVVRDRHFVEPPYSGADEFGEEAERVQEDAHAAAEPEPADP